MIKIAPSLLACDFSRLEEEIRDVEKGGADLLHLDVMDGHYVPNITFGPVIVRAIRKLTKLPLDVHLMITDPEKYTPQFIESGADKITFHIEVKKNPIPLIKKIKLLGSKAGLSLNPETPIESLDGFLNLVDSILVMSVNPGFGGQHFIETSCEKIKHYKEMKEEKSLNFDIEVDGGVTLENAQKLIQSGVNTLIAGTTIFHTKDRKKTIQLLKGTY
ncbi:MAG: ribulose-phosphate 3-epimerase [Candidatus Cloacimonadota bacterium]|nr:MAG: ribulose-phosphate 3-epimerase [Candidatus Cloacimonadota bacterium]